MGTCWKEACKHQFVRCRLMSPEGLCGILFPLAMYEGLATLRLTAVYVRLWNSARLMGEKWCHSTVFVCISLILSEIEHASMFVRYLAVFLGSFAIFPHMLRSFGFLRVFALFLCCILPVFSPSLVICHFIPCPSILGHDLLAQAAVTKYHVLGNLATDIDFS